MSLVGLTRVSLDSQIATLFGTSVPNITTHLGNIYRENELSKDATIEEFLIVQNEHGRTVSRPIKFYNLDAIIAVGYRVNSSQATRFRIWATKILREYIIKGFALDDKRLKQGQKVFGQDYFRELLQRVRSIRASEAQIWRQVTDILLHAVLATTRDRLSRESSLREFKTCSILQLLARPQPK